MSSRSLDLDDAQAFLRKFAEDRDWVRYHTPKNLAMALTVEAGELLEIFQWMTAEESMRLDQAHLSAAAAEMADILQYLIRMAGLLEIDLNGALWTKLRANESRFPVP